MPEFALKYSELEDFNSGTAMRLMRQVAKTVYTTHKYGTVTDQFRLAHTEEIQGIHQHFSERDLPELRIHLFLVPLHNKETLVSLMHEKLKGLQA